VGAVTTKIEWCDETINPIIGCSKVSQGCTNCYAERQAPRLARFPHTAERYAGLTDGGKWTGQTRFVPSELEKPLRWRKPRKIFVCSMGDLFHETVTNEQIADVFFVMQGEASTVPMPHTFKLLTKRPRRMLGWFEWIRKQHENDDPALMSLGLWYRHEGRLPRNIHLGVSIENQETADERVPLLLQTPAAVRFISAEPLLGSVDLTSGMPLVGGARLLDIHQVIVGCESGPRRRETKLEWVRSIRDQCVAAGVAFFCKQISIGGRVSKDPSEWPVDLRIREDPR
jgi:protein gp37